MSTLSTAKSTANRLREHIGVSFSVSAGGWSVIADAVHALDSLGAALDGVEKCALDELHALAGEDLSTAQIKLIAAEIARRVRNSL